MADDALRRLHFGEDTRRQVDCMVARHWFTRARGLLGRPPLPPQCGLLLPRCRAIHTIGMRHRIDVVFLDRGGVIRRIVAALPPLRFVWCRAASMVLELAGGEAARLGLRVGMGCDAGIDPANGARTGPEPESAGPPTRSARKHAQRSWPRRTRDHPRRGQAAIEFLLVGPVLIVLSLLIVQLCLIAIARQHVEHALWLAARAGSQAGAAPEAIADAYLRAIAPLYGGLASPAPTHAAYQAWLLQARRAMHGRVDIDILAPAPAAFADWGRVSTDSGGRLTLPQAGLRWEATHIRGPRSGLSRHEANRLHLRVVHRYPLFVPIAGRLLGAAGRPAAERELIAEAVMQMQTDAVEPAVRQIRY